MTASGGGLWLQGASGKPFWFDPGALCLELVVTTWRGVFESLHEPADLARWLPLSRLGGGDRLAPDDFRVSQADLAAAKELREAIWRMATKLAHGAAPAGTDLAILNRFAAQPPPVPRIDQALGIRRCWARPITGAQAVSAIARDAIELLTGPLGGRIRECAGPTCELLFVDTSRPGARRWCSMERCGRLHKAHAFRQRQRRARRPG